MNWKKNLSNLTSKVTKALGDTEENKNAKATLATPEVDTSNMTAEERFQLSVMGPSQRRKIAQEQAAARGEEQTFFAPDESEDTSPTVSPAEEQIEHGEGAVAFVSIQSGYLGFHDARTATEGNADARVEVKGPWDVYVALTDRGRLDELVLTPAGDGSRESDFIAALNNERGAEHTLVNHDSLRAPSGSLLVGDIDLFGKIDYARDVSSSDGEPLIMTDGGLVLASPSTELSVLLLKNRDGKTAGVFITTED